MMQVSPFGRAHAVALELYALQVTLLEQLKRRENSNSFAEVLNWE